LGRTADAFASLGWRMLPAVDGIKVAEAIARSIATA